MAALIDSEAGLGPNDMRVFEALHEIAVAIAGVLQPDELARLVADHARALLKAGGVGLYLYEEGPDALVPLHSSDGALQPPEPLIVPGIGAAGLAFQIGEPVAVEDYLTWDGGGAWARAIGVRAALAVPLQVADRRMGALSVRAYSRPRRWTDEEIQTMRLLAALVAPALEAARLYASTSQEAQARADLLARERKARLEAEAAIRLRDEVLASVSHDLAGALARIRVGAELLQAEATVAQPEDLATRLVDWSGRIVTGTERMAAIIQELLDVARLQMGQPLQLNRQPMDLVELVQKLVAEYQQAGRAVSLQSSAPLDSLVGSWDAGRLTRVLANLLDNALKYSQGVADVLVSLHAELSPDNAWAVVAVRDTGLGILPEDLPHVFERFFRGRNVPEDAAGTGLGLSGARQIVEQHHGRIDIESTPGVGTLVTIRLPLLGELDLRASSTLH
jgi:signal transduction histidine kinase